MTPTMRRLFTADAARGLVAPACLTASLVVFSFYAPGMLALSNLKGLLGQMAPLAIVALGQTLVIITRGFDISVGSVAALSGVAIALCVNDFGSAGVLAGPIIGLTCGLTNGVLIGRFGIQPVIATLGMLSFARGLALAVSNDKAVVIKGSNPLGSLGYNELGGIPMSFILVAILAVLITALLAWTRAGRRIHMLGSNPEAAEMVGISPGRTLLGAYALTGLLAGIASLVFVGRAGSGLPTEGVGLELSTIAAAVIGGVSLAGGVGKPLLVLVGALFIQSLNNGLILAGTSPFLQELILGAVIVVAGLADYAIRRVTASQRYKGNSMSRTGTKTFIVVAAVMAVLAAGCGSSPSSSGGSSSGGGGSKTIGMSVPSVAESFWISMVYGVKDEAKKRGVNVVVTSAGGDTNANQQISQIQTLMQRKVDALIVGATSGDAVKPIVDQAAAQKIPVIGVSSTPNTDTLASAVYTDNTRLGQIQADCLGEAMGGEGQVGVLGGPAGQSWADMRAKGFTDTLTKNYPNIKVATTSRLADNRNAALTTVQDWAQRFPQLNGIYSATDDIGSGAVDAIQAAHKLGNVKITSSNFSPAAEQLLKNGSFVCVSVQKIVEQGRQAVIQALNAISGKPVKKTVITSVLKLTKENIASTDFGPIRAPEGFTP